MLFLDCEFNGHNGQLLSMALVGSQTSVAPEFYAAVPRIDCMMNDWVKENVIPKIEIPTSSWSAFKLALHDFLRQHPGEVIVADSPADFVYLLEQCHEINEEGKYRYINLNLKMEFVISGDYTSENPHNALADARALKKWYFDNFPVSRQLA